MTHPPEHCNCRCTPTEQQTPAERLMDLAQAISHPREQLIVYPWTMSGMEVSRVKLALLLQRQGPATVLRSICEEWTWEQLVRELY